MAYESFQFDEKIMIRRNQLLMGCAVQITRLQYKIPIRPCCTPHLSVYPLAHTLLYDTPSAFFGGMGKFPRSIIFGVWEVWKHCKGYLNFFPMGAIAVLSNVVSAVPQPNEKIEQIQEKRWSWPWNSGSGHGGHGHGHGGGWGWGDDDDDDDEDGDDLAAASQSALPFTHPHLRPEETSSSSLVAATLLSSSSIALSAASDFLYSISISPSLSSSSTGISTVTDPVLSPISITISSTSSSLTSTPTPTPLPPPISGSVINATSASKPSSTPLQATLILNQSTSLTLCSANPTSIIIITESCTSTHWITVVESGTWTTTPLPANWTTTPLPTPSLPSSISGSLSGAPSLGTNSTGIWTVTPVVSSGASISVLLNSSLSSSVATGSATGTRTGLWSSGSSLSTFVFSSSSPPSSPTSPTSSSPSKSASTSTKESTSTTLLFSTTTLPYPSPSPSSSSTSPTLEPTPISTGTTDLHPRTTIAFTTTVTTTQISGTPNPAAVHCGLHGLPVGDFFLAEFVEDKAGVDVSLRGCWEFCRGVYGIDKGCVSYSFYPEPGTGAPRCDLFGGSVAQSLDSIIPQIPNVWYDLECGDPTLV
ncbi:hypothetical protein EYC80_001132 [Monilinia laxa]|uniref:Uncharacterized protein n=1 Tax=Monilinia laxa TaxID=61186 RepID=A0A5N6K8A2_MONLA|nr:hypothetical protein EYC80_001132 [Monilinia laxa]